MMKRFNGTLFYEKLSELLPCPHNRKTDQIKVAAIRDAIRASRQVRPFVVAEVFTDSGPRYMITDGHHRHEAVLDLVADGFFSDSVEVPCVFSGEEGIESAKGIGAQRFNAMPEPLENSEQLKPIQDLKSYSLAAQETIDRVMYQWLFEPVLAVLWASGLTNAKTGSLVSDVKRGKVRYDKTRFVGEFSSATSAELRAMGAKWEPKWKGYSIPLGQVPMDVRASISDYATRASRTAQKIDQLIAEIQQKGLGPVSFAGEAGPILDSLQKQLKKTTSDSISVQPEFTPAMAEEFKKSYTENLNLSIQKWSQESAERLRGKMQEGALAGFRAETLRSVVLSEKSISNRRAKFIARQETSLIVSKFREERYTDLGMPTYRWSTSHDERVREDHKDLNGRVFSWNDPSIVDRRTGRRANPGEDYGCRCVAKPILNGARIAKGAK